VPPLIWLYACALTTGLILAVPTVLQALDRRPPGEQRRGDNPYDRIDSTTPPGEQRTGLFEFGGFAATVLGVSGLLITPFDVGPASTLIASLTLGLAAGAIHPEILHALSRPRPPS
jgi:hypothetical protein